MLSANFLEIFGHFLPFYFQVINSQQDPFVLKRKTFFFQKSKNEA